MARVLSACGRFVGEAARSATAAPADSSVLAVGDSPRAGAAPPSSLISLLQPAAIEIPTRIANAKRLALNCMNASPGQTSSLCKLDRGESPPPAARAWHARPDFLSR